MDEKRERDCNLVTDLTLGLVDTLRGVAGVQDVSVVVRGGVERAGMVAWEQRNNVTLPQPLKNFYSATDGFKLTWNYATAGKVVGLGNLELLPLGRVNRLGSGRGSGDPLAPSLTDLALAEDTNNTNTTITTPGLPLNTTTSVLPPAFTTNNTGSSTPRLNSSSAQSSTLPPTFHASKMFEVDNCQGYGKVVLAYPGRGETFREGSYWFVDPSLRPHLLAPDTHTYWRLLLAHLGMPQWQALVAGLGLTPWARQWYEVVASYLVEGPRVPRLLPSYQDNSPASRLDPTVFRTRRTTHRTKHAKEHQVKEHTKGKEQSKDKAKEQAAKEQTKEREAGREHAKEQASSAGEQGKGLLTKENGKEQGKLKAKEQAIDQDSAPKENAEFDAKEGNVDNLNTEKKASEKNGEGKTKEEDPYDKEKHSD